ncbi:MAG: hypothetical protein IJI83_06885 [Oscillospiraceae bacterium]|jgi:hypothetical protein|nr:hypothetical protein [Oscillospiraceae bacterium]MBQ6492743.1 hypothetical protein [Erysipelotrichaceae bacterium]
MRTLEEILVELNAAESEYSRKCQKYGIEEKTRRKKGSENQANNEEKV